VAILWSEHPAIARRHWPCGPAAPLGHALRQIL
jgi:hypothetical protein